MKIKQLTHHYGDFSLKIKDLNLLKEHIIGLIGENGSGKTTLIEAIAGVIQPDQFHKHGSPERILYIPSNLSPYGYLRVGEFCRLVIKYSNKQININTLLDRLKLSDKQDAKISTLSQGMKKKLTLIKLFVDDYDLVLLDEPFHGIDVKYMKDLNLILSDIKQSTTIVITSHVADNLVHICDSFVHLKDGQVTSMFDNPGNVDDIKEFMYD